MSEADELFAVIERRVRANVTKNSRGYSIDTTAEITMTGGTDEELEAELARLLELTDRVSRAEVARRQSLDAEAG